jgi:hypothetical protein
MRGESVTLCLNDNGTPWELVLKDASEESLHGAVYHHSHRRRYEMVVTAQRNDNINRRTATLQLSRGQHEKTAHAHQKGFPACKPPSKMSTCRNDSRNVFVVIHTNVIPK